MSALCGGVPVTPDDLVLADDDGIVIAPRPQLDACVAKAEAIAQTETAVLASIHNNGDLIPHVTRLRNSEPSTLTITPPAWNRCAPAR